MSSSAFPLTLFLKSVAQLDQLPPDKGAEIAFIGRSNSGKSSAINAITGKKGLAKISKTPGRTQLLNFFQLNENLRLVDLPGYGFAKVSDNRKIDWEKTITHYLKMRKSLKGLIMTMDIRHPLNDRDEVLLAFVSHYHIPTYILLTKADKLTRAQAIHTLRSIRQQLTILNKTCELQIFSAIQSIGLGNARHKILDWLYSK